MSQADVEIVQRGFEHFQDTGDFLEEIIAPEFVWDMSTFRGWPEQQLYEGLGGARTFMRDWTDAWDDWRLELDAVHDAGEKVVTIVHQHGHSKTTGLPVDMHFAMVWTFRDGLEARMEMYADPAEALKAVGLQE